MKDRASVRLRVLGVPRLVPNTLHLTQEPISVLISVSSTTRREFLELLSWTGVCGEAGKRGGGVVICQEAFQLQEMGSFPPVPGTGHKWVCGQ